MYTWGAPLYSFKIPNDSDILPGVLFIQMLCQAGLQHEVGSASRCWAEFLDIKSLCSREELVSSCLDDFIYNLLGKFVDTAEVPFVGGEDAHDIPTHLALLSSF